MSNNIKILFWVYTARVNKSGTAPLMIRITFQKQRIQASTGKYIPFKLWDKTKSKVKGKSEEAVQINNYISGSVNKLNSYFSDMVQNGDANINELLNKFMGKDANTMSLIQLVNYLNDQVQAKLGGDYTLPTLKKYQVTKNKLLRFMKTVYNRNDISLKALQKKFIFDFDFYMKTNETNAQNTAAKHCKNLKRIINVGINNGWLEKSPFDQFRTPYQVNEKVYLTSDDLKRLEEKQFKIERLQLVKELFLLQCYTGLAFTDMANLTGKDISIGIDGNKWIIIYRKKTHVRSAIPLLPQALSIIEKYNENYLQKPNDQLVPVYSNQKFNSYLHEIAELCGINKILTSHVGRRTFATTIGLANGVSLETISKILGHSTTKITHQYAIVTDLKISEEMKKVKKSY